MAEFLSAGIFIEELKSQEQSIQGVSTSTFATVGWLPRGEENKPLLVGSLSEYFRKFGTYWKHSVTPLAVTAFFKNDGARAIIVRVTPDDAVAAQVTIPVNRWLVKAISKGTWGNNMRLSLSGNSNSYNTATATYALFDIEIEEESADGDGDFEVVETFEGVDLSDDDSADYFPEVLNDEENGSNQVRITEVSGGVPSQFSPTPVSNETVGTGTGSQTNFTDVLVAPEVAVFTLQLKVNGTLVAQDNGRGVISAITGVSGFTSVDGTIDYETGDMEIDFAPAPAASAAITVDYIQKGVDSMDFDLIGGLDGTAVTRAQVSDPALELDMHGLYALNKIEDILNIALADFPGDLTVHSDLISYCENRGDCFAILDTRGGIDAQDALNYKRVTLASLSSYAAMYWPHIKVADPIKNGKPKAISPVGHVAGVYARTDTKRNVAKAPAGVEEGKLNFALGLERNPTKAERDLVYPANINPLISTTQTGRAVWGCRTLQVVGDFNLVPVRRLFMFLEKSIFNSTHDLVFEPIGEELFTTVKLRLDGFMNNLTTDGYFASRVPAEAFRVTIDGTNNSSSSVAARQLITDILVATQNPAEFVRFRFQRSLSTLG